MNPKLSDKELEALVAMVDESARLHRLTNRELVFECLATNLENDTVIEEMMSRIYPNWSNENADGSPLEDKPEGV